MLVRHVDTCNRLLYCCAAVYLGWRRCPNPSDQSEHRTRLEEFQTSKYSHMMCDTTSIEALQKISPCATHRSPNELIRIKLDY